MTSAIGPARRRLRELLVEAFEHTDVQVAYRMPPADERRLTVVALAGFETANARVLLGPSAPQEETPTIGLTVRHYDPRATTDDHAEAVEAAALAVVDTIRGVVQANRTLRPAGATRGIVAELTVVRVASVGPTQPENASAPGLQCDIEITLAALARRT